MARNVLSVLLDQCGSQLNDESLQTFMTEVEAVVNSRPLTVENLTSPDALEPITPNHLLTGKSRVVLPPPGEFQRADLYLRKRWRRVQHLANEFWVRWKGEFLHTLQLRQKWVRLRRNLQQRQPSSEHVVDCSHRRSLLWSWWLRTKRKANSRRCYSRWQGTWSQAHQLPWTTCAEVSTSRSKQREPESPHREALELP